MNVLRKISIDTVLLWLAVALCIAGLVWLGGAHAWIAALGVIGAVVNRCRDHVYEPGPFGVCRRCGAAFQPPSTCSPPRSSAAPACPTCGGDGTIESDEPFMMMSALPCPACSPLNVGTEQETAANHARTPLGIAALRTLAREARAHDAAFRSTDAYSIEEAVAFLNQAVADRIALASAVEQLADALEAKAQPRAQLDVPPPELPAGSTLIGLDDNAGIFGATTVDVPALYDQIERQAAEIERLKAQRGLTSEEMAIIEQTRALVRERDEFRASVDLLDAEGRKMKAERDEARTWHRTATEMLRLMADPFPPGRGPETCGTHCVRCGEKIHLVRPTTGPDREERLENHCCHGASS